MSTAKQVLSDNLRCPICQDLLNRPKLLSCSHTFCEGCLVELHKSQKLGDRIKCAVCHAVVVLTNGHVANFPTNRIVHALVEDFKERSEKKQAQDSPDGDCCGASCNQLCNICEDDDASSATSYCQNCSVFLCNACLRQHSKFKPNAQHEIVGAKDVETGEVKKRRGCEKHPSELEHFACVTCMAYVCCRCLEMSHMEEGHEVIGIAEYEESHKVAVEFLQDRVKVKTEVVQDYSSFVEDKMRYVKDVLTPQKESINKAYEEATNRLSARRDELLDEYNMYEDSLLQELEDIADTSCIFLANVLEKVAVVGATAATPPEDQSLSETVTQYKELDELVADAQFDQFLPESVAKRAGFLTFQRCRDQHDMTMGSVNINAWKLHREVKLDTTGDVIFTTSTQEGEVAVGIKCGDVKVFSADGELKLTRPGVNFRGMGYLSDGQCVVRDFNNILSIYTQQWEKQDVVFETLSKEEGGFGSLTIGADDQIIIDYKKARKIHVFTPAGGQAVREILCDGYEPWQVLAMTSDNSLLALSHSNAVRIMNEFGEQKHLLVKDVSVHLHPVVCQDGTILLACVEHPKGLLSVERFTSDLKYLGTLIANHMIEKPDKKWCYLQEFRSGEIALCTPNNLYIFRKKL